MMHELDVKNIIVLERTEINGINKTKKTNDKVIEIPAFHEYITFHKKNYKVPALKAICKHYILRCSGNKPELTDKIYNHLFKSNFACIIQKYNRRYLIEKYNRLMGPAIIKRGLCMNSTDFFTLDNMADIPYTQFFSYRGENGAVWGFDILSFYNLFIKTPQGKVHSHSHSHDHDHDHNQGNPVLNPYTRREIAPQYFDDLKRIVQLSKLLKVVVHTTLNENIANISIQKQTEMRCLELFQHMDGLGNYTDMDWFMSLSTGRLLEFTNALMDIWIYRAQLSVETKRQICHPSGDPFRHINSRGLANSSLDALQRTVLTVIEQFIKTGIDREMQNLGASYILCGLTLVNSDAAFALPWLFQSVS